MRTRQFVWLSAPLLGLALVLGFLVADINAQTPTPSAPPAQQEGAPQPAPGATDRGAAPQGTTPETRAPQAPGQQSPSVTVESRNETRSSEGQSGRILGVDPTIALVIGAVLLVVIIIALVAMTKRSEDIPSSRSV